MTKPLGIDVHAHFFPETFIRHPRRRGSRRITHPDRFAGCAMLPMQDPARAIVELARAASQPRGE